MSKLALGLSCLALALSMLVLRHEDDNPLSLEHPTHPATVLPAVNHSTYVPPSGPTYPPPPVNKPPLTAPAAGAVPEVYGLKTVDTGVDISAAINAAAKRYGYSAPGYAALMGTESGIHQYAPHYPINGAGYCDYSGGLTQITVCTAAGLGVGNGSLSAANIAYVLNYEQGNANRDVALSARLVDEFHRQVGWDWYPLYSSWNLGPGYGRFASVYLYPTNPITIQAVANFKGWLSWVMAYHVRYGPPPKPPFPLALWRSAGHKFSPYYGKHLNDIARAWVPVSGHCRGATRQWAYNRRYRFSKETFQYCSIFVWSGRRGFKPKVTH